MRHRLRHRLTFLVERLMLRGVRYRLLVVAGGIALITIAAAWLVYAADGGFARYPDAVWWAFLRLTDPGYLGDDAGLLRRTVSTALTILGYVVFLGALIAILTQWLNATMRDLERGLTPIVERGHILILGFTDRTPAIVRELVLSEGRVERFLRRHGRRRLRIVILVDQAAPEHVQELREALGAAWTDDQVILRSGSPLRLEHLRRVDFEHAAAIILPGADFGQPIAGDDAEHAAAEVRGGDTGTIKALLSLTNHSAVREPEAMPVAVAEILDARKLAIARHAYSGPAAILASDAIVSRLIAQNVRHPGLSHLYNELLTHSRGNEVYIRDASALAGCRYGQVAPACPRAIPIGVVRGRRDAATPLLNPSPDLEIAAGDRLVMLARDWDDATPPARPARPAPMPGVASLERGSRPDGVSRAQRSPTAATRSRVLLLGWSHRVPALIAEFEAYGRGTFDIDILSAMSIGAREAQFARYGLDGAGLAVRQLEGDYTVPSELARLELTAYDSIVLLGSSWLESKADSDARTIFGYLLLHELLPADHRAHLLVELMDAANLTLFRERPGEVLISPQLLSHMLAQVALRPELGVVFDELFGSSGAEITFHSAADFGLAGRRVGFADVRTAAAANAATALGIRLRPSGAGAERTLVVNPPRDERWELAADDDIVLLTAGGGALAG